MQTEERDWPVQSVESHPTQTPGELRCTIHRRDEGADHVLRRFPGRPPVEFQGEAVAGDLTVLSTDADGSVRARLELKQGEDSVAGKSH
jgi:hypothetical protein